MGTKILSFMKMREKKICMYHPKSSPERGTREKKSFSPVTELEGKLQSAAQFSAPPGFGTWELAYVSGVLSGYRRFELF